MTDEEIAQTGNMSDKAMGRRAKALRMSVDGLTQEVFAQRISRSVSAVKGWEASSASTGIRAKHVGELSKLAGVRADFIIYGEISGAVLSIDQWQNVREILIKNDARDGK